VSDFFAHDLISLVASAQNPSLTEILRLPHREHVDRRQPSAGFSRDRSVQLTAM
jgi:hypothetical protein